MTIHIALIFSTLTIASSQQLVNFESEWNNDFTSWQFTYGNDQVGEINMRFPMQADWTDWTVEYEGLYGRLKLKYPNNPNIWELKLPNGIIVDMEATWLGQVSAWQILQNQTRISIQTVYGDSMESWSTPDERQGYFGLYTEWQGDFQKWIVIDELNEDIELATKIAMAFICILHSVPRT